MPNTILISQHNDKSRCLLIKEGHVVDADLEWPYTTIPSRPLLDQIYWGRVVRTEPSHVYVKLSDKHVGILPHEHPIPKPLEGQAILVQVRREAIPDKGTQNKGPLLTQKLIFGGRLCLFHPLQKQCLLSAKIRDTKDRNRLHALFPEHEPITLRESSIHATIDQIRDEIAALRKKYDDVLSLSHKVPCLTPYDAMPSSLRWIRDLDLSVNNQILVDNNDLFIDLQSFVKAHRPDLLAKIQKINEPLFKAWDMEDLWDSLFQDVVNLPCGGNIVIDLTTSAVVIDINQGDKSHHETNKTAVPIIIQQLKCRHLGGNIIIDFIGIETQSHHQDHLKELLNHHSTIYDLPLTLFGWSKLGWLEARLPKRRIPLG